MLRPYSCLLCLIPPLRVNVFTPRIYIQRPFADTALSVSAHTVRGAPLENGTDNTHHVPAPQTAPRGGPLRGQGWGVHSNGYSDANDQGYYDLQEASHRRSYH